MSQKILIVVDMQRDFVDKDGALTIYSESHPTERLIDNIVEKIESFDGSIFYTLDSHTAESCEFEMFPPHCILGTDGWQLTKKIKAIEDRSEDSHIFLKKTFTSNVITGIGEAISSGIEIHIVGVCTHICIHDIVTGIVNTAKEYNNIIPKIIIEKDLVSDFDFEMEAFALRRMANLYGVNII